MVVSVQLYSEYCVVKEVVLCSYRLTLHYVVKDIDLVPFYEKGQRRVVPDKSDWLLLLTSESQLLS